MRKRIVTEAMSFLGSEAKSFQGLRCKEWDSMTLILRRLRISMLHFLSITPQTPHRSLRTSSSLAPWTPHCSPRTPSPSPSIHHNPFLYLSRNSPIDFLHPTLLNTILPWDLRIFPGSSPDLPASHTDTRLRVFPWSFFLCLPFISASLTSSSPCDSLSHFYLWSLVSPLTSLSHWLIVL